MGEAESAVVGAGSVEEVKEPGVGGTDVWN